MKSGKPEAEEGTPALSYWDVLKHLHGLLEDHGDAALQEIVSDDSSEDSQCVSRRTLLKCMAASISLAGLTACRRPVETILPYVDPPERMVPGVPRHYATTMPLALSAYGLVVKSVDGRPIKIEGNPLHPSTAGASNVLMQAAILGLYDPDRSQAVQHDGEEKPWDDFAAAWQALEPIHLENGGSGLAVLSESFSSPTLTRLKAAFRTRFPDALWANFDPTSDENVFNGIELATGRMVQPAYAFEKAKVILSLDSDFLLTDTENVAHAQGFAKARRVTSTKDSMNRLYVAESAYSLTGANADHRMRIRSGDVRGLVVQLLGRLQKQGLDIEAPGGMTQGNEVAGADHQWIEVVAKDLLAHRGEGLIIAGSQQPPGVHALAFALNDALGNVGATVTYHEFQDSSHSRLEALRDLVAAMNDGSISTLVILSGNPVYNAPVDLDFTTALAKVDHVIHLSPYVDETSRVANWHVPETHFLEAWGDARAVGGPLSVIQPLIRPLFGAKSPLEVLGLMTGEPAVSGYDQVRKTWRTYLGETDFDKQWNRVLHDGLLAGSKLPSVTPTLRQAALAEAISMIEEEPSSLEIVFRRSPAVYDGRFANNGWLQELPDAVTKITWDNVAAMSPKTAADHGVRNEDRVRIHYRDRSVETPVWIVPGHADNSVSVTLGYGRRSVGRVGDDVGADMFAIRTSEAPEFDSGLRLETIGTRHPLAGTQDHATMEGRPIVREASLDHYRDHPDFAHAHGSHATGPGLFQDPVDWHQGYQWGMTIDLSTCTGCNACVVACQSENNVPIVGRKQVKLGREMHWLRIDRYFTGLGSESAGHADDPQMVFQPMPCQHCETAPCEQVCPVAATTHDSEGLNVMVYNRCIGTRYCSNNCPYKVRRFNYFDLTRHMPEVMKLAQNPDVTVRSRGVMEKCSFCLQRITAAKKQAKMDGHEVRDGDVQTACQQSCPVRAIRFGRIDDPASLVTQNKSSDRNYDLLGDLNTRPRVSYLAKLRNPHPELKDRDEAEH
jgi:molybdopterin-containing oxidoreductase family iron-sulfur binding subunit